MTCQRVRKLHIIAPCEATGRASQSMGCCQVEGTRSTLGRAYVYLSEKKYGTDGYRSGLRGKCPVEIKVALAQAVEGGVIFRRSAMDGIMTAERIPSQYIISITADDRMLWNRAESNLEPSTWERAADPVTSGSGVELVPQRSCRRRHG